MLGLFILLGVCYLVLRGETNIEITNKTKNKKYKFHSKDFKCKYESEEIDDDVCS